MLSHLTGPGDNNIKSAGKVPEYSTGGHLITSRERRSAAETAPYNGKALRTKR